MKTQANAGCREGAESSPKMFIFEFNGQKYGWPEPEVSATEIREAVGLKQEDGLSIETGRQSHRMLGDDERIDLRKGCKLGGHCLYLDGERFPWPSRFITVPQMRELTDTAADIPIVQEMPDGTERTVPEDERIDLGQPCHFGRSPRFKRGSGSRTAEELTFLRRTWPDVRARADGWVEIPDYLLPTDIYSRAKTVLGFRMPPNYPMAAPDNFFVEPGLTFKDGRPLTNYSESKGPCGGQWGVFSFHPEGGGWKPGADVASGDNLRTFMRAVRLRLQEAN